MTPFTLNLHGRPIAFGRPAVMGILNATPDSFYGGSRAFDEEAVAARARSLVADGADIIDIGACSTRPGAESVDAVEERRRLAFAIAAVRRAVGPDIPLSVDTFRASVAAFAVEECGADIVNDIAGGTLDPDMFATVARLRVPYVLMHMRGTPPTMLTLTDYPAGVTAGVIAELSHSIAALEELGVADIIVDPGFGFAKTLGQNYELLAQLQAFDIFGRPVLVGVSRKSMFTKLLDVTADDVLAATVAAGTLAVERGAAILRVHDPRAARHSIAVTEAMKKYANL